MYFLGFVLFLSSRSEVLYNMVKHDCAYAWELASTIQPMYVFFSSFFFSCDGVLENTEQWLTVPSKYVKIDVRTTSDLLLGSAIFRIVFKYSALNPNFLRLYHLYP